MEISKETGIAQSTVYDRAQSAENFIRKHTAILDFEKLGLSHFFILVTPMREHRVRAQAFLEGHAGVNSLYKLPDGMLAETVFRSHDDAEAFFDSLSEFGRFQRFIVLETSLSEEFLTEPEQWGDE